MVATWLKLLWERLRDSSDAELAAIAGKALKEARYHQQHAADWVVRLGDGTDESRRRCEAALARLWLLHAPSCSRTTRSMPPPQASGLGPARVRLREPWLAEMREILDEASWRCPPTAPFAAPASAACTASTWATS